MKKGIITLLLLSLPFPLLAADQYKIDHAHSSIGFSVRHMLISKVKGEFENYTGTPER